MATIIYLARLIHLISGVGWLGEVITINFVLLPALFRARSDDRIVLLNTVFPLIFRLATVLGGAALLTGLIMVLWYTQLHVLSILASAWGRYILIGGGLGAVLYFFHVFQEAGAERSLAAELAFTLDSDDPKAVERLMRHLAIFPRGGMALLVIIIALMSAAAHFA